MFVTKVAKGGAEAEWYKASIIANEKLEGPGFATLLDQSQTQSSRVEGESERKLI